MLFITCKKCGNSVVKTSNNQKRCKKCADKERAKKLKHYMCAFYERHPHYDRDYKRWYRKMLKEDD